MTENQKNIIVINHNGENTRDVEKQILSGTFPTTKSGIGYAQSNTGLKRQYKEQRNRLLIAEIKAFQKIPVEQKRELLEQLFDHMATATENLESAATCTLLYFDQESVTIAGLGDCPAGIIEIEPTTENGTQEKRFSTKYIDLFTPHKNNQRSKIPVTRAFGGKNLPELQHEKSKAPHFMDMEVKSKDKFLTIHSISLGGVNAEFQDLEDTEDTENIIDRLAFPQNKLNTPPKGWSYEQNLAHQLITRQLKIAAQKYEPSPCVTAICVNSSFMQTVNCGYLIAVLNGYVNNEAVEIATNTLQKKLEEIISSSPKEQN